MQLQDFLNKARAKKNNEVKVIKIEVKDIGAIEFTRPDNKKILEYMENADEENITVTKMLNLQKKCYIYIALYYKKKRSEKNLNLTIHMI